MALFGVGIVVNSYNLFVVSRYTLSIIAVIVDKQTYIYILNKEKGSGFVKSTSKKFLKHNSFSINKYNESYL